MTPFTRDEQWDHNYDLFIADSDGRIGHFSHIGFRLLPPSIARSKESWERLFNYFDNLPAVKNDYWVCPDLSIHLNNNYLGDFDEYLEPSAKMSSRGLYSFDSYDYSLKERPYFRVTIPKNELRFSNLPKEIKQVMTVIKSNEISFAHNSVISENIISTL